MAKLNHECTEACTVQHVWGETEEGYHSRVQIHNAAPASPVADHSQVARAIIDATWSGEKDYSDRSSIWSTLKSRITTALESTAKERDAEIERVRQQEFKAGFQRAIQFAERSQYHSKSSVLTSLRDELERLEAAIGGEVGKDVDVAGRMRATGGGGYCITNPLPCDAPAGLSMSTMRGLERRELVEEFHSGMFRATTKGLAIIAAADQQDVGEVKEKNHGR